MKSLLSKTIMGQKTAVDFKRLIAAKSEIPR